LFVGAEWVEDPKVPLIAGQGVRFRGRIGFWGERTNYSYHNRGILTVGLKTKTVGFVGLIFFPLFFHNFISFHPILMFHTILESGDQTNTIEDELTHKGS
jgi:hypothetical protein